MVRQGNDSGDLDIDVASLFGSIWRNKGKLLSTAAIVTALAGAVLFVMPPKYNSETRIFIEQRESVYTRPAGTTAEDTRTIFDNEGVTSQVQLVTSADVLGLVASDPQLAKTDEFKSFTRLGFVEQALSLLNRGPQLDGTDRVIAKLRDRLNVYRVENSRIIVVEFSSEDPKLAAAVPNKIAEAYLKFQTDAKLQSETKATSVLAAAIGKLEKSLPAAEAAVASYRSQNDILLGTGNSALATQQLSELSTELSRVRAARVNAEANARSVVTLLQNGGSLETVPEILASGLMQRLRERQVQLKNQIADLSATLLDSHPQMKGLRSQLADLDAQIRNEAVKIERSLKTQAETAANRETELTAKLNGLKAESARVSDDEIKLRELEREATTQRQQLEDYKARYREAVDRQVPDFQTADARVIQKAEVPGTPYFPKYIPSLAAAFVGTLLFSSVILLLRELFSGRAFRMPATRPEIIQDNAQIGATAAPAAPSLQAAQDNIAGHASVQAVANRLIDEGEPTALIVSPEGAAACAASVMIARELADQGLKVILLDLTGTSAAARPMLDGLAMPGITNLLAGDAQLASIVHNDAWSEAMVIPTGTADPAKAAKAVARLPMIINALSSAYDMVLIECGAATPSGLKRIVMPGSRLLVSVIDPDSTKFMIAMTDLVAAGYDDLELIALAGSFGAEPGRSAA